MSGFVYKDGYVEVFTDGSSLGNGQPGSKAGVGVWFNENHPLNISTRCRDSRQTNSNAEIDAANRAIEQAYKNGVRKLLIYTDSEFLYNSVTKWMSTWKVNGWRKADGKEVENRYQFQLLDKNMSGTTHVMFQHVPAHKGIRGNEMADQLAKEGADKPFLGYT